MAIGALLATLERETDERIALLLAGARAEAAALVSEADAARQRRRDALLAEREAVLQRAAAGEVDRARREARAGVLGDRAGAVERIFARARQLLAERRDDPGTFAATLAGLEPALDAVAGRAVVRCRPQHVSELSARLDGARAAQRDVTLEGDPAVGTGFMVTAADGSVSVDATLEARLEGERPRLAIVALRVLETPP